MLVAGLLMFSWSGLSRVPAQDTSFSIDYPSERIGPADPARAPRPPAVASGLSPRLVRFFDFEEPNNSEMMPRDWYAIGRPEDTAEPSFRMMPVHRELIDRGGYPAFNPVGFNKPQREEGNHYLHLRADSGSVGAFAAMGSIVALPATDYLITARIRTTKLRHARARLSAGFVNQKGEWLEDGKVIGPDIGTALEWETVQLHMRGTSGDAAWLVVWVELLQPRERHGGTRPDEHTVLLQDIEAEAWIDDIAIWQIPRIILRTQSPVNIVRAPQKPIIRTDIRDHADQEAYAQIRIYDEHRRLVDEQQRVVGRGASRNWAWTPNLPGYGWYLADLQLSEDSQQQLGIGRSILTFLWLGSEPELPMTARPAFSLQLSGQSDEELALLPALMSATGLHHAALSVWDHDTGPSDIDARQQFLGRLQVELGLRGTGLMMSFDPMTEAFAARTRSFADVLEALGDPQAIADPMIRPVLRFWGQRVRRWITGPVIGNQTAFEANLDTRLAAAARQLRTLAPDARILLPWTIWTEPPAIDLANLNFAVEVPRAVSPANIPLLVEELRRRAARQAGRTINIESLFLDLPTAEHIRQDQRVTEMMLRLIYSVSAEVPELVLSQVWTPAPDREAGMMPDPVLGAFSETARRLVGQRVVSAVPMGPGVRCLLLDGEQGPMLAAWVESDRAEQIEIDLDLGGTPRIVDVWGNTPEIEEQDGRHRVTLGPRPIIITGIDGQMALLRAGFRLDQPFIRSNQIPQQRQLLLYNPWPRTIHGHFRITSPEGWNIRPMQRTFSIPAHQQVAFPLSVQMFPRLETAGDHRLTVRLELSGEPTLSVDLHADFQVGLQEVELDSMLIVDPSNRPGEPGHAVVVQRLTNRTDRTLSIRAFATLQGHPMRENPIPQLLPGQSLITRLRFNRGAPEAAEHGVRTGIEVSPGNDLLIHRLSLDVAEPE